MNDFLFASIILGISSIVGISKAISIWSHRSLLDKQSKDLEELDKRMNSIRLRTVRNIELIKYVQEFEDELQEYLQLLDGELNIMGINRADE